MWSDVLDVAVRHRRPDSSVVLAANHSCSVARPRVPRRVHGIVLRYPARRSRLGGSCACVPGNVAVLAFLLERRHPKLGLGEGGI